MKRLIVVYNPRSSRYAKVRAEVLDRLSGLSGYMVGKYEVAKVGIEGNVERLGGILKDEDLVIAAGGDATGVIAANAILESGKDCVLAMLPYGNFNDLARTLKTKNFDEIFKTEVRKLYPLEVVVDGEHWRYATCYVTMGMMAEAVKLYDTPRVRRKLKKGWGRAVLSYTEIAGWYFKNRRKKVFLPELRLNGELKDKRTSDYVAVNGRSVARVMKGGEDFLRPKKFRSETERLTVPGRLMRFMMRSILSRVPGQETQGDVLELVEPGTIEVQAEGESRVFKGVQKIEVRKAEKWLKVATK